MTRPPRYYFRPSIGALLVCWLFGHRWVHHATFRQPGLDGWGNQPYDCTRCGERVSW